MTQLETDRLVLRMFTRPDFEAYASIFADPQVMEFIGDGKPLSRLDAWRSLAATLGHWQLLGYGMWAVEEKVTRRLVGRVGFINPEGWPGLELGWTFAREFWGRGYAAEAARFALRHGFSIFGFTRVISLIHPQNVRSIRLAERLGAIPDGTAELSGKSVLLYVHGAEIPNRKLD